MTRRGFLASILFPPRRTKFVGIHGKEEMNIGL